MWRTSGIIFTFSSFASQEVDDSVERKTVENKPNNDNMEELAVKMDTKLRHTSSEKSSEDESQGNSEVTDISIIYWFPHMHKWSTWLHLMMWNNQNRKVGYMCLQC